MNRSVRVVVAALAAITFLSLSATVAAQEEDGAGRKNVILFIGDGMGFQQVTLARLVTRSDPAEPLFMETLPVLGYASTWAEDCLVTDSAAAATALATGHKVANGVVAQRKDGRPIRTILEAARDSGFATGLVTTTRITHATPAGFAAHDENRDAEKRIAKDYLETSPDVLLGGGARHFDEGLLGEFRGLGYQVATGAGELRDAKPGRVLGLFAESHLAHDLDREGTGQPSLEELTRRAIELLSGRGKGFFLMVEGGRIDHAGHAHDAASVAADTAAFDRAIRAAVGWAVEDARTLVVVTADHTTGGQGITERIDVTGLRRVTSSAEKIAERVEGGEDLGAAVLDATGIELTEEEKTFVAGGKGPWSPALEIGHVVSSRLGVEFYSPAEQARHRKTEGHDGTFVPVWAMGAESVEFRGAMDNTDIARKMAAWLGVELER